MYSREVNSNLLHNVSFIYVRVRAYKKVFLPRPFPSSCVRTFQHFTSGSENTCKLRRRIPKKRILAKILTGKSPSFFDKFFNFVLKLLFSSHNLESSLVKKNNVIILGNYKISRHHTDSREVIHTNCLKKLLYKKLVVNSIANQNK